MRLTAVPRARRKTSVGGVLINWWGKTTKIVKQQQSGNKTYTTTVEYTRHKSNKKKEERRKKKRENFAWWCTKKTRQLFAHHVIPKDSPHGRLVSGTWKNVKKKRLQLTMKMKKKIGTVPPPPPPHIIRPHYIPRTISILLPRLPTTTHKAPEPIASSSAFPPQKPK